MGINEIEENMKETYNDIKSGKVTRELKHDAKEAMYDIKNVTLDAKDKIVDVAHDIKHEVKHGINNIKGKL
ncbi:MAG: hypothetical protein ACRDA5_02035 [Clostridium sp.]